MASGLVSVMPQICRTLTPYLSRKASIIDRGGDASRLGIPLFALARLPLQVPLVLRALRDGLRLAVPGFDDQAPAVLLVDDNADDLLIFRETLAPDGYRIVTARTAKAALDILANDRVGLVISDQNMPAMQGVRFLAAVRKLYPGVTRAMLTGSDQPDTLPEAVNEAGIHKFLSKHWDGERLRQAVREACRMPQGIAG